MKLRTETLHQVKFTAESKQGRKWVASAFVNPFVTVDCTELLEWLKEKLDKVTTKNGKESK